MDTKELKKALKKLGVELTGEESDEQLQELLNIAKEEKENEKGGEKSDKKGKKKTLFIWLKSRAYITDDKRVDGGFYNVEEVPARLSKLGSSVIEVFEDEVPPVKLAKIARWCGINPDGKEYEEILSTILSVMKPF